MDAAFEKMVAVELERVAFEVESEEFEEFEDAEEWGLYWKSEVRMWKRFTCGRKCFTTDRRE